MVSPLVLSMNALTKILPAAQVLLDVDSSSKKRVFEQVGMLFEKHLGLGHTLVFDSLFAREKLGSTGLGQGVAIPHGRIKGLKQAAGAFLRLKTPVPFDAPDGRPVNLMFVLLVPEQATEQHLQTRCGRCRRPVRGLNNTCSATSAWSSFTRTTAKSSS